MRKDVLLEAGQKLSLLDFPPLAALSLTDISVNDFSDLMLTPIPGCDRLHFGLLT